MNKTNGTYKSSSVEEIRESINSAIEKIFSYFESGKYEEYLRVMSKFHHYSYRNTLLIAMQRPDATMVAGYESWKKKFGRQVNKGEKAIKILAPSPYRTKKKMEVIDRNTQKPVRREDGTILTEEVEVTVPAFRVTNVFDINVKSYGTYRGNDGSDERKPKINLNAKWLADAGFQVGDLIDVAVAENELVKRKMVVV